MGFAERILRPELELIAGVEETLAELATRHRLTLFTKGHAEEQRLRGPRSPAANLCTGHEAVRAVARRYRRGAPAARATQGGIVRPSAMGR